MVPWTDRDDGNEGYGGNLREIVRRDKEILMEEDFRKYYSCLFRIESSREM